MNTDKLRKRLYQISCILLLIASVVFIINYFVFHYVTDGGITFVKQAEAGKPFVTDLIGQLGVNLLSFSIISALSAKILCKKEK